GSGRGAGEGGGGGGWGGVVIRDDADVMRGREEQERAGRSATVAKLTARLAHDIKNRLNSLQIHAQLLNRTLREPKLKAAERERVTHSSNIILEEISRLNRVVNDFLTAVRPTRPLKNKADINRLIEHVYATLQPELESRGIECQLRLDREIPSLDIDPAQVTQVFLNLLKNSMEALEEKQEQVTNQPGPGDETWRAAMEIQTRLVENQCVIRISDNGPGIPEEDLLR